MYDPRRIILTVKRPQINKITYHRKNFFCENKHFDLGL